MKKTLLLAVVIGLSAVSLSSCQNFMGKKDDKKDSKKVSSCNADYGDNKSAQQKTCGANAQSKKSR